MRGPTCDERGCKRTNLTAQFTMKLKDVTKETYLREPQPQFYCEKHRELHPNISPTTGALIGGDNATTQEAT
jgi:hypothetical protein